MFNTIVVGSDGSASGDSAVAMARSLAAASTGGSRILVVHVIEVVGGKGGLYPLAIDEHELRTKLEGQIAELKGAGIPAELAIHAIRLGGPAHVIAAEAETASADLIVVGSRGHAPLAQYVLGGVPLRLLHLAHCPVLVVPSPKAD